MNLEDVLYLCKYTLTLIIILSKETVSNFNTDKRVLGISEYLNEIAYNE